MKQILKMDLKVVIIVVLFAATTAAQQALLPQAPENVLFQLTSHDSFVIAWSTPPGPLDYYLLDYYPDGKTSIQVAINETETHQDVVDSNLDFKTFGLNLYSVFNEIRSDPANITVLMEHDVRLPPMVTSATKQWTSASTIQLQWTLPQGQYDMLLLLYAPKDGGVAAQSVYLNTSMTSHQIMNVTRDQEYVIHLYTVRNGIHSDPAELQELKAHEPGDKACDAKPCQNGGDCEEVEGDPNMYRCECNPGFDGTMCENNINECAVNPCQNNGQCVDGDNAFTCTCTDGYEGAICEKQSGGAAVRASLVLIGVMYAICGNLL